MRSSIRTGTRPDPDDDALAAMFAELVALDDSDPRRQVLRDELIEAYLPVAERIARRFSRRGEPLEDLTQVARLGLINAVDRFDPELRTDFLAYAVPTITGEVRKYFRDSAWAVRTPRRVKELYLLVSSGISTLAQELGHAPTPSDLAQRLGISVDEVYEGLEAANAYRSASLDEMFTHADGVAKVDALGELDKDLHGVEDRETIRPLLEELADRDRRIVLLRFVHGLTQTQIADQVGVSQMQVSRILSRTLGHLRKRLDKPAQPDE
ncbi:SigB/SigF/SigG family RNA polymerase sigma factor [Saccharopolyspora spinosa]|uniref:RNA polymerase sigma-37 (RpsB/SigB) subunit n=1 Tax=Saccharopolyspora spinosa TaxID=60894 RepID=A0A2N3Y5I5_SACSN|nr:SigB/SigF/SigG family RNA polymerase sigma factor [Saccharopolyspora spinosa]PKW18174.1 RNA polymerase sigma-37 (RpsB/SigB) subunit [Saccharopolyspora spinosa]